MGRGSPSKRSSTYGSSSKMVKPNSAARASSLLALLERQRAAGRVLEVRDDVRERRTRALAERHLERVDLDAVRLERDGEDLRAQLAEREQRPVVGGRLDDHEVARLDELLEQERVGLHRAVRGDDAVRRDVVLRGDPLEEARVPGGRAVGERARGIALEGGLRGGAQVIHGDDVERRSAASEGDVRELGQPADHDSAGARRACPGSRRRFPRPAWDCVLRARPSPPAPPPWPRPFPSSRTRSLPRAPSSCPGVP